MPHSLTDSGFKVQSVVIALVLVGVSVAGWLILQPSHQPQPSASFLAAKATPGQLDQFFLKVDTQMQQLDQDVLLVETDLEDHQLDVGGQ